MVIDTAIRVDLWLAADEGKAGWYWDVAGMSSSYIVGARDYERRRRAYACGPFDTEQEARANAVEFITRKVDATLAELNKNRLG